jgi:hypothetical protein
MPVLFAQGDILIEQVGDLERTGAPVAAGTDGAVVVAEGEETGHRHAIYDRVTLFRDDSLARDIPSNLYIGHLTVEDASARLLHPEHATVTLPRGTYRLRRQRQVEPMDVQPIAD